MTKFPYLEDQESFVIKVDTFPLQHRLNFCECASVTIDCVSAGVVCVCRAPDNKVGVRNHSVRIRMRDIDDLLEVDLYGALISSSVAVCTRVVNELAQFALSHLARSIPENKQQRVDRIGFSGPIGSHDT
jgi:hypothetical protein